MFSENLRKIRKYLNLTVDEFAQQLGMPSRTIGGYERKERTPSIELAVLLSEKFDININWLLFSKGEMFLNSPSLQKTEKSEEIEDNFQNWGRRLQKVQTVNKMTDEEFSKILDISQSRLCDLCLHNKTPRCEELLKLKQNFDISIDWLLFDDGSIDIKEPVSNNLGLTKKQIEKLKEMLSD